METNFREAPAKERVRAMTAFIKEFARSASEAKNSEELIRFLAFSSIFHNYSLNNTILIWCQKPEATYVRGYRQWQEMNRNVKKGAKAIFILIPTPKKIKEIDENGEEKETVIPRFKWGSVFDISDTDGEDIPELNINPTTSDHQEVLDQLINFAKGEGFSLNFYQDPNSGEGSTDNQTININTARPIDSQALALAHELAHTHLHFTDKQESKAIIESEAETVAVTFAHVAGIQNNGSEKYVARWTQGVDTEQLILSRLERIKETVEWLFAGIFEKEGDDEQTPYFCGAPCC